MITRTTPLTALSHRDTSPTRPRRGRRLLAVGLSLLLAAAALPAAAATATAATGFPTAATTGVPAGVTLRSSGSLTITQNGTVIDGLDIRGTVTVQADNVTIRNSRITATGDIPIRNRGANLVVEDTEIDGNGKLGPAVGYNKYTLTRVNIHNIGEGPRIAGGNVVIQDSYIHHLVQVGDNHTDAIQVVSGKQNIVIRGNNIQIYNPDTRMYGNAAFQFGEEDGIVRGCVVENNLMNGGNYTVNGGGGGTSGAACEFHNNQFQTNYRYGVKANLGPNVVWASSNRMAETNPTPTPTPTPTPNPTPPLTGAVNAYVDGVYRDLLGRGADSSGLATWTSAIQSGSPLRSVANAITSSTEFRGTLIQSTYREFLGRGADPTGMQTWQEYLRAGRTIQDLEVGFISSAEFYAKAGGNSRGWVTQLYATVLGRSAGNTEINHWVQHLASGASRQDVARGFVLSSERLATVVDRYYASLLGRSIDASGRETWVRQIQGGVRVETVIGSILSSTEYVRRVTGTTL